MHFYATKISSGSTIYDILGCNNINGPTTRPCRSLPRRRPFRRGRVICLFYRKEEHLAHATVNSGHLDGFYFQAPFV